MATYVDLTSGLVRDWFPVTPNNTTDNVKANPTDIVVGLTASGAGNVVVTNADGVDRTIPILAGEKITFVGIKRIKATGTTATGIMTLLV